jgi:uncharacterized repeat protein (TIGR04138 family)
MQPRSFEEVLETIVARDRRYHRDAYIFVREALDYTQKLVGRKPSGTELNHVSCKELLGGIRELALKQFGPLAVVVLEEWGVRACEDFGEIVFNMIESNLLAKTDQDTREEFKGLYDFHDAFRRPFLPADKPGATVPPPSTAQA